MTRRLLILTIALAALACATTDRNAEADKPAPSRYVADAGDTPVGVIPSATLRDAKRDRDVPMTIDYPTRGGPHPLIIFSHGYGSNGRAYVGLSTHWASNGYVVIKPTHRDNTRAGELGLADFRARAEDIRFILDSLPALQQKYPELQGKIDSEKIGVGGHSLGALTAMLAGGARLYPGPVSLADARVKAIIAMSPQGPRDAWGLTRDSFAELRTPALFLTGTNDRGLLDEETPEWRTQAFELSPAGDKWLMVLAGAGHIAFTGAMGITDREMSRTPQPLPPDRNDPSGTGRIGEQRPSGMVHPDRNTFNTVKILSLAFWDTYLRGDAAGREILEKADSRGLELKRK